MLFAIPQLLKLIETTPEIRNLQLISKPLVNTHSYKSAAERMALELGATAEEANTQSMMGSLEPGNINIIQYFIGIQVEEGCKLDLYIYTWLMIFSTKQKSRYHFRPDGTNQGISCYFKQ